MLVIDAPTVRRLLPMSTCIAVVRAAMLGLSSGQTRQPLRQIVGLAGGRLLGSMPGALFESGFFGAKLISVDHTNRSRGKPSHQGGILLFEPDGGAPVALIHAGEITAIRTAAASAVATDALARPDARRLAVLGYGEQALAHARAIPLVRRIEQVGVWGRDPAQAADFARRLRAEGLPAQSFGDAASCVADADIICTTTSASDPILFAGDVGDGAHINLVGSSLLGPREIDDALVARARFFCDSRPSALAQAAEFDHARRAGVIDEPHLLGEIGEVLAAQVTGRSRANDLTIYKSLGHVVQDLASACFVFEAARAQGLPEVPF